MKTIYVLMALLSGLAVGACTAQTSANISVNGIANQPYTEGPQILNAIPTPPPGAHEYTAIQNASGWVSCAQACAGGGNGIAGIVYGVTSPSLSGSAMQVTLQTQHSISGLTVSAGGSGYVAGDLVTVVQSGATQGQATVATVSSGVVTGLTISSSSPGSFYSIASALPTTGGTGTGLTVNVTAVTGPANALDYQKTLPCPPNIPGGCVATADIHLLEDYYLYISASDAGIQAIENDPDIYDGTNEYFNSRQCDSASGMWRLWNMKTNNWITTSYPCPMLSQTNVWHHMREYTVISRITGLSTYQAFEYDGATIWSNLGQSFPPQLNGGYAAINFEVQLDLNAGAGIAVQSFYIDNMNAWVW